MVDPRNGWLHKMIQGVIAASVVAVLALGCASPQAPTGADAGTMVQTLGEVSVSRDGDDSIVRLEGLVDPIYSVRAPDDQSMVVVDLVWVGGSEAASQAGVGDGGDQQIATYDGVVDLVTVSTFDDDGGPPLTRVEVALAEMGDATVSSTGDGLEIRITPGVERADAADTADVPPAWEESDYQAASNDSLESASSSWAEEGDDTGSERVGVTTTPPPAATELIGISAQTTDGGVLVALQANGGIGSIEAFSLADPPRLVVDLPGLAAGSAARSVAVESNLVAGVRLGAHDGKVRVVLDGGSEADDFQGRQIMPGATGLWIAIGEGEALSQAMDDALSASEQAWLASAAPMELEPASEETTEAELQSVEEMPAALAAESGTDSNDAWESVSQVAADDSPVALVDEPEASAEVLVEEAEFSIAAFELAEVYGLHYERTDGMDRTAILSDESIAYTTSEPDATTLVVSIPGARISEAASDRIFPKAGGPISMVHVFQQPDVEVPEVRVVFTRAPDLTPVVSRRGSMIFIDFEDVGVAAAPPPAFPNAGVDEDAIAASSVERPLAAAEAATSADPVQDAWVAEATPTDMAGATPTPDVGQATMPMASPDASPASAEVVPVEVVSDLPNFDPAAAIAAMPVPDPNSLWEAPTAAPGGPAAVEVPAAIEVLEEGGLIDGKDYRGRRVSLDFKNVAIADVLRLIAEVSDLNIIAGDEVSGNVTIRLVEVPWDQALDVILMTKGLGFVRVGNVLRIAPSDVLKAEEEVRLQERRNKEKLEDLEVKLLPVNYAAVKDTEGLVKRLLSARGTVNLDERTNTLIIKDISSVIDEASALIAAIDTQTPQVMIEAKIVEANLDFSRELGSVWGIQTQQFVDPFDPDTPRTDLGSEDLSFIDSNSLAFANPITSVPTGLMTLGALILDQDFRVDAQIQAAESTGDGKVISSPRIVTLDNSEAKIEQGVSIPFQTFEGGDAKLEFIDAVLSLVVTPHVTADESIIMAIEVTRNAPDDTVATPTGSPAIAKNVAETETLVKDGQTLVLGGIYTITKSKRQSRIPYLHRIPVIGNAFKNNEVTDARKELLVFVTPRIVRLPEMARN